MAAGSPKGFRYPNEQEGAEKEKPKSARSDVSQFLAQLVIHDTAAHAWGD